MSDLISRSALINKIRGIVPGSQDVDFIVGLIENQPTAFDVENVVAELEKRADDNLICADRLQGIEPKSKICEWKGRAGGFKTAIEVVKRGGAE